MYRAFTSKCLALLAMDRRPPSVLLIAAHDTTSVCSCHFYLNAFFQWSQICYLPD